MDTLKQKIKDIAEKYADCVNRTMEAQLKKEEPLTVQELQLLGSGFSLLNHAAATLERIDRLQRADGHENV